MNRLFFVLIVLLATPLLAEDKNVGNSKTFEEKGKFSVGVPEDGYEWKKAQDLDSPILKGAMYKCKKKDSKRFSLLVIAFDTVKTAKARSDWLKGIYQTFQKNLEQNKVKIVGDIPDFNSIKQNQATFPLKAQLSDGRIFRLQTSIIFGRNTFIIGTASDKAEEDVKEFNEKIVKTFKELDE